MTINKMLTKSLVDASASVMVLYALNNSKMNRKYVKSAADLSTQGEKTYEETRTLSVGNYYVRASIIGTN